MSDLLKNSGHSVLLQFRVNLLLLNHVETLFNSMSVSFFKSVKSEIATVNTGSFAYEVVLQFVQCGKIIHTNRKGPSMLRCGTRYLLIIRAR